jgi:hypothetical protein
MIFVLVGQARTRSGSIGVYLAGRRQSNDISRKHHKARILLSQPTFGLFALLEGCKTAQLLTASVSLLNLILGSKLRLAQFHCVLSIVPSITTADMKTKLVSHTVSTIAAQV